MGPVLGTVFGFIFGPRFGGQFWVLLIRNKRHAPNSVPILVPVLGPVLGPFWNPFWEPILSIFVCKLVVLEHLGRATFLCQRLFLHRFSKEGAQFWGLLLPSLAAKKKCKVSRVAQTK